MLFAAHAAQAAEIKILTPEQQNHQAIITIHGPLNAGDDSAFFTTTLGVQHAVVFLDCGGGSLGAAISIGWSIRSRNFQTALTDNGICASACTLIWLGGATRYLGLYSRIGFHSAAVRSDDGKSWKRSAEANRMIASYLERLGYPAHLLDYITQSDPQFHTWLTPFYATKYKIYPRPLTELNSRPQTR
jgi:hypothetical protein